MERCSRPAQANPQARQRQKTTIKTGHLRRQKKAFLRNDHKTKCAYSVEITTRHAVKLHIHVLSALEWGLLSISHSVISREADWIRCTHSWHCQKVVRFSGGRGVVLQRLQNFFTTLFNVLIRASKLIQKDTRAGCWYDIISIVFACRH